MPVTPVLDEAAGAAPSFIDLGVPAPMVKQLDRRGIAAPFPIQAAAIPDALAGRDLCGRAPTGSGKTIAFGIPLVLGVGKARSRRPRALVLVPTRELASQVAHELQQLAKPRGPWVEPFYGGVGFPRQVKALQRGVDIAVACPGRLADLVNQGCADLSEVDMVVVDEADRMADMGFLPEVRRLLDQCCDDRQTLLFSATLDGDVDVLIQRYQRDPVRHELHADDEEEARGTHLFWAVERSERLTRTAALIARAGPTVVFCRTKRGADRVARQLGASGITAAAIHGDRSQAQRERALRSFHDGHVKALVATDVAARGIHVDGVACVVHFDPPQESKDYVHRSGRTARAGASGLVVTLVIPEMRKEVKRLQRELGYDPGFTPPAPETVRAHPTKRGPKANRRENARPVTAGSKEGPPKERRSKPGRETDERHRSPRAKAGHPDSGKPRAANSKDGRPMDGQGKDGRPRGGKLKDGRPKSGHVKGARSKPVRDGEERPRAGRPKARRPEAGRPRTGHPKKRAGARSTSKGGRGRRTA